jgi:hypothetical protein
MEFRLQKARTTKGHDFTVRNRPADKDDSVLALLQEVGAAEIDDWFSFRVSDDTTDLDRAPYGGFRYPVEAMMAGRTFVKFHLDVGLGDAIVDPTEEVSNPRLARLRGCGPRPRMDDPERATVRRRRFTLTHCHERCTEYWVRETRNGPHRSAGWRRSAH